MVATVRLAGSARPASEPTTDASERTLTTAELAAPGAVTVHLREARGSESLRVRLARQHRVPAPRRRYLRARELMAAHGAAGDDIAVLSRWAESRGLTVRRSPWDAAALELSGSLGTLARAFEVQLRRWQVTDSRTGRRSVFRDHDGEASVPAALDGVVTSVLGLSTRPVAGPRLGVLPRGVTAQHMYTPAELAGIYDFPVLAEDGAGSTLVVGIAELGGAVHRPDLGALAAQNPRLRIVEETVHGWGPVSDPGGADVEVALDWQVIAGALAHSAPQADVVLVIKYSSNTDRGFSDLLTSFATDGRDYAAVSTSWGAPESSWSPAAMDAMERAFQLGATRGIVHTVAAGDNGSGDAGIDGREHADHPASAPSAVSCGGTTLVAEGDRRISETAWNELAVGQGATGGGVSSHFAVPRYQMMAGIRPRSADDGLEGRGVPDVAGNADPLTGYLIHHRGADSVVGGTSAVAPLWSALVTAIAASTGHRLGDVHTALYEARSTGFSDVSSGDNGAYTAVPGWDPATGLGAPCGRTLCESIRRSLDVPGPWRRLRVDARRGTSPAHERRTAVTAAREVE